MLLFHDLTQELCFWSILHQMEKNFRVNQNNTTPYGTLCYGPYQVYEPRAQYGTWRKEYTLTPRAPNFYIEPIQSVLAGTVRIGGNLLSNFVTVVPRSYSLDSNHLQTLLDSNKRLLDRQTTYLRNLGCIFLLSLYCKHVVP